MSRYLKNYSTYYDEIYGNKNYYKEANFIKKIINKNLPASKTILELGFGTGNHATYLKMNNFDIIGVEKSSKMIKIFKKKKIPIKVVNSDMRSFKINKKFDVVIALFCVMNYLLTDIDLKKTFYTVNRHLKKGGLFIFDFWYTPAVLNIKPKKTIVNIKTDNFKLTRLALPKILRNNLVNVKYKYKLLKGNKISNFFENHKVRHFNLHELNKISKDQNLNFQYATKMLDSNIKPSKKTWKVCAIYRKSL